MPCIWKSTPRRAPTPAACSNTRQGAGAPNKHVQVLPLGRHGLQLQRVFVGALLISCSSLGRWRLGPSLPSPRPCVAGFVSLCSSAPVLDTSRGRDRMRREKKVRTEDTAPRMPAPQPDSSPPRSTGLCRRLARRRGRRLLASWRCFFANIRGWRRRKATRCTCPYCAGLHGMRVQCSI